MALKDDLLAEVSAIFTPAWTTTESAAVPTETSVTFGNDGVYINATVLYADLSDSTKLVDLYDPRFAAAIYKAFLRCASRIIRSQGGTITAFDGDRVMAVYMGNGRENKAAWTAMKINTAMHQVIRPRLLAAYPGSDYVPQHTVGIDSSRILVVKDGVRGDNDLLWIGRAANYAAKLCALDHTYQTRITRPVLDMLQAELITDNVGSYAWTTEHWPEMNVDIFRSSHFALEI